MIGEIDIYGVFLPPFLLLVIATLPVAALVRMGFSRLGVYHAVWHRPLFDLAVFIIILGGLFSVTNGMAGR